MSAPCAAPIGLPALLQYWFGELAPQDEARLEEHLFGCDACAHELAALAGLGAVIATAFRDGAVEAVVSAPLVETMKRSGLRIREYRVAPGGSVQCTIGANDDAVIGRLEAPLAGVARVDMRCVDSLGTPWTLEDIPFDPATGEVLHLPSALALKKLPAHQLRVRLLAVDAAGERLLGEYTFNHSPG